MAKRIEVGSVHRVPRKLAGGEVRVHHYLRGYRGRPAFWTSDSGISEGSPEYLLALTRELEAVRPSRPGPDGLMVPQLVDAYLDSNHFRTKLRERTQRDYRKYALAFAAEFRDAPAAMFEAQASRQYVEKWLSRDYGHSPKQHDYAVTVVNIVLNWARKKKPPALAYHHLADLERIYEVDRSEIVWTPEFRERFNTVAPAWVRRILDVACETGLRPDDLCSFSRAHVETTAEGRRFRIRTKKRRRVAAMPITPALDALLATMPKDQLLVVVGAAGRPLTPGRASEAVKMYRNKAGLGPELLGYELHLHDARGTAATRLLRAGAQLNHIAAAFGISLRTAHHWIERYAAASPDESDDLLRLLAAYDAAKQRTNPVNGGVNG